MGVKSRGCHWEGLLKKRSHRTFYGLSAVGERWFWAEPHHTDIEEATDGHIYFVMTLFKIRAFR